MSKQYTPTNTLGEKIQKHFSMLMKDNMIFILLSIALITMKNKIKKLINFKITYLA